MESQVIESTDAKLSQNTTEIRSTRSIPTWLINVLLLITWLFFFGAIIFFWKKTDNTLKAYKLQITQIHKQFSQFQFRYQTLENNVTQMQKLIHEKLPHNTYKIQISDIRVLVHQAQNNLVYLNNVEKALSLLKLANKHLVELSNFPIETLHNLLMQNIKSLKDLSSFKLGDALIQLSSLQKKIAFLPIASTIHNEESVDVSKQLTAKKKWLPAIFSSVQPLIIIRHLDEPVKPLLLLTNQQYLQLNLHLLLHQAQWAIINGQQKVYQINMQQTKEIIQKNFLNDSPNTQTLIKIINELERINLQPNLPDLTPTLDAIDSIDKMISIT